MLLITRGAQEWRTQRVRAVHRAVPGPGEFAAIPVAPGIVIWTPPVPALVRTIAVNIDTGDPLLAAGGALNVRVGLNVGAGVGSDLQPFVQNNLFATWNVAGGRVLGAGNEGPGGTGAGTSIWTLAEGGVLMTPVNALHPGEANLARAIVVSVDVGTATGTMLYAFQWRPFG